MMIKLDAALGLRRSLGKSRILVGKERFLEFGGHADILLHVFLDPAHLLGEVGRPQLGLLVIGYIP